MLVISSKPPALYTPGSFQSTTHLSTIFGAHNDAEETRGAGERGPWTCFQRFSINIFRWVSESLNFPGVSARFSAAIYANLPEIPDTRSLWPVQVVFTNCSFQRRYLPELCREKWCIQVWRFHASPGRNLTAQGMPPDHMGTDVGLLHAAHWPSLTKARISISTQTWDICFHIVVSDSYGKLTALLIVWSCLKLHILFLAADKKKKSSWTGKSSPTMRYILCRFKGEDLMGRLFAKETERRQQEMEMGREMKRRKNIETIGEMTGRWRER